MVAAHLALLDKPKSMEYVIEHYDNKNRGNSMKKSLLSLPIILGIIVIISVPSVVAQSESNEIPSWVKKNMVFWGDGLLEDNEVMNMLQWLINSNIIQIENNNIDVENTTYMELAETPIQIVNMQKIIDDLQVKNDELENDKDVLEEEFMKKESENGEWYEKRIEDTRLTLTKHYEDKINIIIDDTDADMEKQLDSYRALSEKNDKLWGEYQRLYGTVSGVAENTNPDDFK